MRHFQLFACFMFLATIVLAPQSPPAAAQATAITSTPLGREDFVGMAIRDPYYEWNSDPAFPNQPNRAFQDRMGQILADTGVNWVRLEMHIRSGDVLGEIQKNAYFINEVAPRHGLHVLAVLAFDMAPGHTLWDLNCEEKTGAKKCIVDNSKYGGGVNNYMQTWLDNALAIADFFGGSIHAYEVLNEQNRLPDIYNGQGISPQITGRLITKFYRFCRGLVVNEPAHGCGTAKIILGGLHPRGTSDAKGKIVLTDEQYLDAIYTDTSSFAGFKASYGYFPVDGIAYHPYPEEVRQSPNYPRQVYVDNGVDRMLRVISQNDPGKPMWITEIGYNVAYSKNKPDDLGAFVYDIYTTLAHRPGIANTFWFKYEDFAPWESTKTATAQKWGMVRIPFRVESTSPDGTHYQTNGEPVLFRQTYWVLRALNGIPPGPARAYIPLIGK